MASTTTTLHPVDRAGARAGLRTFATVLVLLSGAAMAGYGLTDQPAFGAVALLSPAVACVAARLRHREGFGDVSWRWGGRRTTRLALAGAVLPLVVGVVSYGAAALLGLADVDLGGDFGRHLAAALTVVGLGLAITAISEELGWRGYLATRLVDAGVRRPVLVGSLAWALWHVPLTFLVGYAAGPSLWLSVPVLVVQITAAGYVVTLLRFASGSLWPAVVFHGWWNATIQFAFDPATSGADHAAWVGESGVLTTAVLVAVALVVARRPWEVRRRPDAAPEVLTSP